MTQLRYLDLSGADAHTRFGTIFSKAIRELSAERVLRPSFYRMKEKAFLRYPTYCREIYDRAQGAGANGDLYFAAMLSGVNEHESCTDLILRRADGALLYGHNEDGAYTPDNCAIVRYSGSKVGFTEFSAAESIPGYSFLWNDAGLITSVNYIQLDAIRYGEPSVHFLLRDAAEATCIGEVRSKLSGTGSASAFSLNVYDTKTRRAYSVEQLYDQTDILEVTDRYAHSNHLRRLGTGYAREGSDTKPRLETALRLLGSLDAANATLADIGDILAFTDPGNPIRSVYSDPAVDSSPTGATMLVDSETDKIIVIDRFSGATMRFKKPEGR